MNNKLFLPLSLLLSLQATATYSMEAPAAETPVSAAVPSQDGGDSLVNELLKDYGFSDKSDKPKIEEGEYKEKRYSSYLGTESNSSETKNNPEKRNTTHLPRRHEMQIPYELLQILVDAQLDPFVSLKKEVNNVNTTLHAALAQQLAMSATESSHEWATLVTEFGLNKSKFVKAGDDLYEFLENPNRPVDEANAYLNHPATNRLKIELSSAYVEARTREDKLNNPKIALSQEISALKSSLTAVPEKKTTKPAMSSRAQNFMGYPPSSF